MYLQARMEPQAEYMLVLIGATPEGEKELLGFQVGVRESAQNWRELLVDLKARGLAIAPKVAIGEGALGFWKALDAVQRLDLSIKLNIDRPALPVFAVLECKRRRTGIILATRGGSIRKFADVAERAAAPLNFAVERALRARVPLSARAANRIHQVDLSGAMGGYVWGLNGVASGHDKPLMVAKGERVEIVMTNRIMMSHPMHLHGHTFQVVAIDGQRFAGTMRDMVLVPPMKQVTIAFNADNPGHWAFHCHNLYHVEAGMMTTCDTRPSRPISAVRPQPLKRNEASMSESIANLAQQDHWNTVAGPKWVGLGEVMETRMRAVNDLLLTAAAARPGEAVLDVGCGTGTTTLPLAVAVGEQGAVLGIDISDTMLATARTRIGKAGLRNVELLTADAQVHGFETERFDLVASRFGVMFFADPVAAFKNIAHAIRPGGRLCFVCWAPLADNLHWKVPFDLVAQRLGAGTPKAARSPGPLALSDSAYVAAILTDAAFTEVDVEPVSTIIEGSTPEQEAEFACLMGPSGSLVSERRPDAAVLATIKQDLSAAFGAFDTIAGLRLPASVFVVRAKRA